MILRVHRGWKQLHTIKPQSDYVYTTQLVKDALSRPAGEDERQIPPLEAAGCSGALS